MKNDGRLVDVKDSADFIRVVREPDSGSVLYNVLEYYPKGQKKRFAKSSRIDPVLHLEGQCIEYYTNGKTKEVSFYKADKHASEAYRYFPNGKLYTIEDYGEPDTGAYKAEFPKDPLIKGCNDSLGKVLVVNGNGHCIIYNDTFKKVEEEGEVKDGLRVGDWKGVAENSKLRFTEQYAGGKLITGTAADSLGTYTYKNRMIGARYKNGIEAFYRYLGNNIEYPVVDRQVGRQGTVLLTFIITKSGTVNKIKVIRSVSPAMDAEAVRVLQKSKDWLPGVFFGRLVDAQFTVPISFALR